METANDSQDLFRYGGISGVKLAFPEFDLGHGVVLRQTYAHLFSANMMAFARPAQGGHHPAPWRAANGGFGYDIDVEVKVPIRNIQEEYEAREKIWLIAALLRMAAYPYLSVPVISDQSFRDIPAGKTAPSLDPLEVEPRGFASASEDCDLSEKHLGWVAAKWFKTADMLRQNSKFLGALKAFDSVNMRGRTSPLMLALWGGIEELFAPSKNELRFRISALLACYLEKPGIGRLNLCKSILKLYDQRSIAAHTTKNIERSPVIETFVLMRNILVRMVDEEKIPTQADLEALLFCVEK